MVTHLNSVMNQAMFIISFPSGQMAVFPFWYWPLLPSLNFSPRVHLVKFPWKSVPYLPLYPIQPCSPPSTSWLPRRLQSCLMNITRAPMKYCCFTTMCSLSCTISWAGGGGFGNSHAISIYQCSAPANFDISQIKVLKDFV